MSTHFSSLISTLFIASVLQYASNKEQASKYGHLDNKLVLTQMLFQTSILYF